MMLLETRRQPARAARPIVVDEEELREHVGRLSVPRHLWAQARENRRAGERIAELFSGWGYRAAMQGAYRNVVAVPDGVTPRRWTILGAHYDSVATTPGADDNASGVAVMLACARALAGRGLPVAFIAFNGEEDGLLGSADFVESLGLHGGPEIGCVHVLEMVGFTSRRRGSQRAPVRLPIPMPDTGDFLGLLGAGASNREVAALVRRAETATPELRVLGLETFFGVDRLLPVLHRSDHSPFWKAGIPAVLWTDTAEFRNPNYHRATDLPGTLDYRFMRDVAALLLATAAGPES